MPPLPGRRALRVAMAFLVLVAGVAGVQLQHVEVSAAPVAGVDWARRALATMAPVNGQTSPAARAIDGDATTTARTGARAGVEAYLQIDFGAPAHIAEVRVVSPTTGAVLLLGDDRGIPGSTVAGSTGAPGVTVRSLGDATAGVTFRVGRDVRFLRVQAPPGVALLVTSVEAFTDPAHVYVADTGVEVRPVDRPLDIGFRAIGPGPVTWAARGLPRDVSIDHATGRITGTPTRTGRWPLQVTATGTATGRSHTARFDLVISPGSPSGPVQEHPDLDPTRLSNRPTPAWGVVGANASQRISGGNPSDSTPSLDVTVWDMQQLGDWMYVGGEFDRVMAPDGTTHPQKHLARFSVTTGAWDPTWRPALDGNVHALEVNDRGRLLVGGEFTSVDGVPGTAALALVDPETGTVDPGFVAVLERRFTDAGPIVRELEVVGPHVYVGGAFSHVGNGTSTVRVRNAARLRNTTGSVDPAWLPQVLGGSVWGIGVDQANGLVHLNGWFPTVGGSPGTDRIATVDTVSGALATTVPVPRNTTTAVEIYDVEAVDGDLWYAGSQHVMVAVRALDRSVVSWQIAGHGCPEEAVTRWCGDGLGGDFQFVERIGDFLYAGCHCNRPVPNAHWSSGTRRHTDHVVANAYRAADGALVEEWNADIGGGMDGGWSVASDTHGCLWIGGDIVDGGFRTHGGRVFARASPASAEKAG
jgi:hypothetical protein